MSREEYLKSRNANSIDIEEMYSYYMSAEHEIDKIGFQQFQQYLQAYLQVGGNLNKYWKEKDIEFGVLALRQNDIMYYY